MTCTEAILNLVANVTSFVTFFFKYWKFAILLKELLVENTGKKEIKRIQQLSKEQ
jgi:hypothetical protein